MKEIKLINGLIALVDDADYEYLNQFKWRLRHGYVARTNYINGIRHDITMSREIMQTPVGYDCDHKDHNKLNNQKSNLRNCTRSQNNMNQKLLEGRTYKGVHYNGKYIRARIKIDGETIHLGYFATEKEAAIAYNTGALKYFGEFAYLNNIPNE
jgi:hypothetical protein